MIYALLAEKLIELTLTIALLNHQIVAEAKTPKLPQNEPTLAGIPTLAETLQFGQNFAKKRLLLGEGQSENPIFCSCVILANFFNPNVPLIDADKFEPNITGWEARIGDIVLEKFTKTHHIATIINITNKGYIVVESNYKSCEYGEGRIIPYQSKFIWGFYRVPEIQNNEI